MLKVIIYELEYMKWMIFWSADKDIKVNMIFPGCLVYCEDHVHLNKEILVDTEQG